jgi:ferritin-like metal-binding protein YciE
MPTSKSKTKNNPDSSNGSKGSGTDSQPLLDFFVDEIKDIYWAEKHIVKTLPKMRKAASSESLKQAFEDHLEETKEHVNRLERVFQILGEKVQAKKCDAMEGIIKEGDSIVEETDDGTAVRDVGLVLAAQKVEHYEISTYGGLAQLARTLGKDNVADLLESTLKEEKNADTRLTEVAEEGINYQAAEEHA